MKNRNYIEIGKPKHGWLPIEVRLPNFELIFGASDVLNDPLQELLDGMIDLNSGRSAKIVFWLEPSAYFFRFERLDAKYTLTISETNYMNDIDDVGEIIKVIQGNYKQIIFPIVNTLVEFSTYSYENEHWPSALDLRKLEQVCNIY